jgi:hypothetical protein
MPGKFRYFFGLFSAISGMAINVLLHGQPCPQRYLASPNALIIIDKLVKQEAASGSATYNVNDLNSAAAWVSLHENPASSWYSGDSDCGTNNVSLSASVSSGRAMNRNVASPIGSNPGKATRFLALFISASTMYNAEGTANGCTNTKTAEKRTIYMKNRVFVPRGSAILCKNETFKNLLFTPKLSIGSASNLLAGVTPDRVYHTTTFSSSPKISGAFNYDKPQSLITTKRQISVL